MKNDTAVSLLAASLVLALVCVPVMAANVTYPQEYYTLGDKLNGVSGIDLLKLAYGGMYQSIAVPTAMSAMELRRQTILMEKQNELLAEQNELMGRLVNATEIKFECKAIGYVQQASYWSIDEPEVNASDYYYKINPADVVPCANLSYFERANYGCPS